MVPILAASAPLLACGLPVGAKGGQMLSPAADSLLTLGLSASNRYTVLPWPSVSTRPSEDVCALMIVPARLAPVDVAGAPYAEVAPAGARVAALAALFLVLPPVRASTTTTMATATRTPAIALKRFMVRISWEGWTVGRGGMATSLSTNYAASYYKAS